METNMTGLFSLIKFYWDLGLRHWDCLGQSVVSLSLRYRLKMEV